MNVTCKRLLSWLVVLTMVLSMVPVVDLSNFAVTTKAAENPGQSGITHGQTVIAAAKAQGEFVSTNDDKSYSAICPVCGGDAQTWTAITAATTAQELATGHYYLSEAITAAQATSISGTFYLGPQNGNTVCLNLNGKQLTVTGGRVFCRNFSTGTMNIMDTVGTSVVTGTSGSASYGSVFHMNNQGTINVYGGTFKRNDTASNIVHMGQNGATLNMYGGKLDDSAITSGSSAAVYIRSKANTASTFNMYGGEIVGGTSTGAGASVRLGEDISNNKTVFNMYDGVVSGGKTGNSGGNFYVNNATLNVYGGTIKDGVSTGAYNVSGGYYLGGGNISLANGGILNMEGGVISGGTAKGVGGNIHIRDTVTGTINVSGGKIYGGAYSTTEAIGLNIWLNNSGAALNISGDVEIAGEIYAGSSVTTLSGTPKIMTSGLYAADDTTAVTGATGLNVTSTSEISATGVTGGEIQVTGTLGTVFSKTGEDASAAAQYFSNTDATLDVAANDSGLLEVVEYVDEPDEPVWGVFDPVNCGGLAYCEACGEAAGAQEWTAFDAATHTAGSALAGHYYLTASVNSTSTTAGYITPSTKLCFNLNGNDLTTAARAFFTDFGGGTLNILDTAEEDGTVSAKTASNDAVIRLNASKGAAKLNIYGGNFKKATGSNGYSSIIRVTANGGTVNMYGGTIDASNLTAGTLPACVMLEGGVLVDATDNYNAPAAFTMHGGSILGGTTTADGGSIRVDANATFTLNNGTISGGVGKCGGNFNVNGGVLNVHGGTIKDGKTGSTSNVTVSGGNIMITNGGTLNMDGGVICGGEATVAHGGNIQIRRDNVGHINITGGKIYGGTAANGNGHNIYAYTITTGSTLSIGGTAEIAGDIYAGTGVTTTLSGTPKIKTSGLYAADGTTAVTAKNGGLTVGSTIAASGVTGGEIQVTAAQGKVLTDTFENAATVAEFFSCTTDGLTVAVNDDNKLVIVEDVPQIGVFEPWEYEGMAYCEACMAQNITQEPVEWEAIDNNTAAGYVVSAQAAAGEPAVHDHVYLAENISKDVASAGYFLATGNHNTICLNLNGKTLEVTNGRAFMRNFCYAYWNVMDTEGGATVTGNGVFRLDAAGNRTVDVYGGTFKTNSSDSIVYIGGNGGTFNLHDGTLDATGAAAGAFGMQGKTDSGAAATFNMYGGEIIGNGEIVGRVGTVLQANANGSYLGCASFNMTAGTVSGGYIQVRSDNFANISGGFIEYLTTYDGAYEEGGSDVAAGEYTKTVNNQTVTFTVDYSGVTTVTLTGAPTIAHLDVGTNVVVNIAGLTTGAQIAISGAIDTALFDANADEAVMAGVTSYAQEKYVSAENGVVFLRMKDFAVVTAEGRTFYKTINEAIANAEGGYIELHADGLTVTINGETYMDNRGYTVTVNGEGTLYIMDSANDDYDGYNNWTVNGDVSVAPEAINPINGRRYISIKETDAQGNIRYNAHRIQMYLTGISLRPSAAGLYYKAAYKCDAKLAALVTEYGIALRVDCDDTKPELDQSTFGLEADKRSILEGFTPDANHTVTSTSTLVYGIFKDEAGRDNATYGELAIEATPYIKINGNYLLANIDNATANAAVYEANNGRVYEDMSMYDVLKHMNDNWNEEKYGAVKSFYQTWDGKGIEAWAAELPKISGYVAPEAQA